MLDAACLKLVVKTVVWNSTLKLVFGLQSNLGMANVLAEYHAYTGSWRGLQHELSAVDALRGDDVVKAARTYLGADNCFAGYVETLPSAVPVPVPTGVPEA
eukprot:159820-Chlamydomonas_euryale.AAC.1